MPNSPYKFEQPKIALEEEKSCNGADNSRLDLKMMAFNMPEGYNTTKTKGNTDINFLPGTNLKIIKGKKPEDLLENKSPGSNPEASTGPTLKLTKNHTLAKLEPSDEEIQNAKDVLVQPQMQLQPAEILPNQDVAQQEMAIAPAVAQGIPME